MTSGEIVITLFIAFVSTGLGTVFWRRLTDVRGEISELRQDMREVRGEIAGVRSEIGSVRSDLTQVALAVGARRPRASEG
ncbi:MAG: hypothetical protein ACRDJI_06280 [Actinomycetota bacterium]